METDRRKRWALAMVGTTLALACVTFLIRPWTVRPPAQSADPSAPSASPGDVEGSTRRPGSPGAAEPRAPVVPGKEIRGQVRDSEGLPIAGAEVTATPLSAPFVEATGFVESVLPSSYPTSAASTRTSTEGRFALPIPVERPLLVYVEAQGFVPAGRLLEEANLEECDFILSRGFSIEGTVVDVSGAPLAGASVRIRRDPFYSPVPQGIPPPERVVRFRFSKQDQTSPDGSWRLEGIDAGFYVLEAFLPGHSTESASGFEVPHEVEVRIVLRSGGEVLGRVIEEESGRGIVHAFAGIDYPPPGGGEGYEEDGPDTRTDDQGQFVLKGVRAGTAYVRLRIDRQTYTRMEIVEPGLSPGEVRERDVRLKKGCHLRGRVEDTRGRPVAGAEVSVQAPSSHGLLRGDTTNEEGRFAIPRLAPEVPLHVEVEADGFTPLETRDVVPPRDDLVLTVRRTGALEVEVTANGLPVPSYTCELYEDLRHLRRTIRMETCRAEDGRLSIEDLPASTFGAWIEAPGFAPHRAENLRVPEEGSTTLRADLSEGRALTGRVVDRSTGDPRAGIRVAIAKTSATGAVHGSAAQSAVTDSAGEFALEHVGEEGGALTLSREGRVVGRVPYRLQRSGSTRIADIEIGGSAVLHGVVLGPSGRPLSGATVGASLFRISDKLEMRTGEDGAYRLEVASGRARAYLFPPPTLPAEWYRVVHDRVVDLEDGEIRRLDFDLTGRGAVTGKVTYQGEALQVEAFVDVRDPESGLRQVGGSYIDPGARYWIPAVPPGRYFVLCRTADPLLALDSMRVVTVAEGETVRCDFDLQAGGIVGVLRAPNGQPPLLPAVLLKPLQTGAIRLPAFVEPDGSFASLGLAEGRYRLEARAAGCAPAVFPSIDVPGDRAVRVDINLEPEAKLAVVARRPDGTPSSETQVAIHRPGDPDWPVPAPLLTDGGGVASFTGLASGPFEIEIKGEGLFPLRTAISLKPGESLRLDVTVRRRGDLGILARGADGSPRSGVAVSVVDQATGIDARQWVAAGLVRASDAGLRTDSQGVLRLEGLPEGAFVVSAAGRSATAFVPADGTGEATLALP